MAADGDLPIPDPIPEVLHWVCARPLPDDVATV
jgi:hypothetical protein